MWSRLFTILAFILCLSTPAAAEESPLQKVIYDATEQAANHPDLDSALNQSIEELQNTELDGIPPVHHQKFRNHLPHPRTNPIFHCAPDWQN